MDGRLRVQSLFQKKVYGVLNLPILEYLDISLKDSGLLASKPLRSLADEAFESTDYFLSPLEKTLELRPGIPRLRG